MLSSKSPYFLKNFEYHKFRKKKKRSFNLLEFTFFYLIFTKIKSITNHIINYRINTTTHQDGKY